MAKKNSGKKAETKRTPADQLLLEFIKKNNLILIVDDAEFLHNDVKGFVYTKGRKPRVRVYYADQVQQKKPEEEKVELVN